MSALAAIRQGRQGYLLSAPALALYLGLLSFRWR
jgi:putative spermidine/putrescine transport system permease protein